MKSKMCIEKTFILLGILLSVLMCTLSSISIKATVLFIGIINILFLGLFKNKIFIIFPFIFIFFNNYIGTEKVLGISMRHITTSLSFIIILLEILKSRYQNNKMKYFDYKILLIPCLLIGQLLITQIFELSHLIFLSYCILISALIYININSQKNIIQVFNMVILSALVQCGIGAYEFISQKTLYYEKWAGVRYRDGIMRIGSTAGDPNFLCFYLIPVIPILFYVKGESDNRLIKFIYNIIIFIIICIVLITSSRTGLIALIVTFILIGFSKSKMRTSYKIIMIVGVILIVATSILPTLDLNFSDSSFLGRYLVITIAFKLFFKNPIFGIGLENFQRYSNYYLANYGMAMDVAPTVMNTYLQMLCEVGIVGSILFFYIIKSALSSIKLSKDKNLSKMLIISWISWFIMAFTLDGIFTPVLWILIAVSMSLKKIQKYYGLGC